MGLPWTQREVSGINVQRASQIVADPLANASTAPLSNYLSLSSFAPPDLGTLGNAGRNSIVGPMTS